MHIIEPGRKLPPGHEVLPLGKGIPGVQLILRNPAGDLCGVGELGEIHFRSPHLAAGYLNDPSQSAERFGVPETPGSPRTYRTGDLGRYLPDGSVVFAGRSDRQVKLRGFRVEPAEVEAALVDHPEIGEAIVVLREDMPGGPGLAAYIVPGVPEDLRLFLRNRLPDHMIPAAFFGLVRLPLTPNGKLDTGALPSERPAGISQNGESGEPRDVFERGVAETLEDLLEVRSVGRDAHFFELGGHSLLAIRLFARLEQRFGRRLPLATLFRHPTVAGLAAVLRGEENGVVDTLVPIRDEGTGTPFFCVHGFGGGVLGYAELAGRLGDGQLFYGLQAHGMDGEDEPDMDVATMAARYIEAVRRVQPEGPYRLGGYCYGGVVAYEMARQLQEQGQETEIVAIFEGYAPRRGSRRERIWSSPGLIRQYIRNLPYWWKDFVTLGLRGMWARTGRVMRMARRRLLRRMGREIPVNLRSIIDEDTAHIPEIHRRLMEIHFVAVRPAIG
jgi:acyl carrier protein